MQIGQVGIQEGQLRVLLIIGSLRGGGAERVMAWLANELCDLGDQVHLFTLRNPDTDYYPTDPRVTRHVLEYRRWLDSSAVSFVVNRLIYARFLQNIDATVKPHVVLAFMDDNNISACLALAKRKVPIVVAERVDPHFSTLGWIKRSIRPLLYRSRAHSVVVQSQAMATDVKNRWRLRRVEVIGNAVLDMPSSALPQAGREKRVLAVGRLDAQKGYDTLIRAWAMTSQSRPDWTLRIAGEGSLDLDLRKLTQELQVTESVEFLGRISNVSDEYSRASIFVLSSQYEGFPNALLEAMSHGCAIAATNCPGATSDVISDGINGLLVPVGNSQRLSVAIDTLIDDINFRERLGRRARETCQHYKPHDTALLWRLLLSKAAGRAAPTKAER